MIVVGLVLTGLAALFHIYVFYLESVAWTSPRGRAAFGMTAEEAQATKLLAFNQGFYNLFLALTIVVGTVLVAADTRAVGATLVIAGAAMMVGAGVVLISSDRSKARAGLLQAGPPALGIVALAIGLAA
jgi:putative membrane protein